MPRRKSLFSFSLKSPKPDQPPSHPADQSPPETASLNDYEPQGDARYIPRQWQPNRLATLYVTPSEENLYLAAMASLDQPPPILPLWSESAPQIPPQRQATPLDPNPPDTTASRQRFNLPLSPKLVTSPTLPPEGLTVRDEFRSFAQLRNVGSALGAGIGVGAEGRAKYALVAFAEESTIRFHNFPHANLVQLEKDLEAAWPRGFTRKHPALDKLKDRSAETGHTWVVSMRGKVWRKAGNEELGTIRLVLALLTSLGMQGWQLVEKVQATGMRTDHHNLLFAHSNETASWPPAFFAVSIPLPDRISLISPPNKVIPALITAIRQAIIWQDRHNHPKQAQGQRGRSGSVGTTDSKRQSVVEWDSWKGGIKLEGFVHPGVYRFWIDGLRRWLSGAVKWNVVEKLHPPLILALINTLGAEHFHLLTSLPLLPLQKGRDVLIFQSVPASGLSYLDSWRDVPSVPPSVSGSMLGRSLAGEAPVIVTRDEAMPGRGEILPAELQGGRTTRQRDRETQRGRASEDYSRGYGDAGRPYTDGRLKRHASVDSRPNLLDDQHNPHEHARAVDPAPDFAIRAGHHTTGTNTTGTSISSDLPPRPLPVFNDPDRPLTPESVKEAQAAQHAQAQRKRNVLTKKPSLKEVQAAQAAQTASHAHHAGRQTPSDHQYQQRQQQEHQQDPEVKPRRSFSFGRMRGYRKPSLRNNFNKGKSSAPPLSSDQASIGYGGLAGEVMPEAVHLRSRHGIGSDATGELAAMGMGMGLGGLGAQSAQSGLGGDDWSLVDLPRTGEGLGLTMYAPSRRPSGEYAREREQDADRRVSVQGGEHGSIRTPGLDEGEVDISHASWAVKAPAHTTLTGQATDLGQQHRDQYTAQHQQSQAYHPRPPQRELSTPGVPMPGTYTTSVPPPAMTRGNTNTGTDGPTVQAAERTLHTRPSFDSGTSVSEYHDASDRPLYGTGGPARDLHIANPTPPPQSLLSERYPSGTNADVPPPTSQAYPYNDNNARDRQAESDARNVPRAMPAPSPGILPMGLPLGTGLSIPNDKRASQYTYSSEPMTSTLPIAGLPLGQNQNATLDVPLSPGRPALRGRGHDGLIDVGSVFGAQSVAGSVGYMGGASQSVLGLTPERRSVQLPDVGRQQQQQQANAPLSGSMVQPQHTPLGGTGRQGQDGQGQTGQGAQMRPSQYATYVRDLRDGKDGSDRKDRGDARRYDAHRGSMSSVATGEAGPGPGSRRTRVQVG